MFLIRRSSCSLHHTTGSSFDVLYCPLSIKLSINSTDDRLAGLSGLRMRDVRRSARGIINSLNACEKVYPVSRSSNYHFEAGIVTAAAALLSTTCNFSNLLCNYSKKTIKQINNCFSSITTVHVLLHTILLQVHLQN